jgi:hypothetical protein
MDITRFYAFFLTVALKQLYLMTVYSTWPASGFMMRRFENKSKCQPYYKSAEESNETPSILSPSTVPIYREEQTEAFFSYALND